MNAPNRDNTSTVQLNDYTPQQVELAHEIDELTQQILVGFEYFLIDLSIAEMQWDRFIAGDTDLARYAAMESLVEFIDS